MNKDVQTKWTERLRSEQDIKTAGALGFINSRGVEKHCAIGVLCEIAVDEGILEKVEVETPVSTSKFIDYKGGGRHTHFLIPAGLEDWSGFKSWSRVMNLNDQKDKSFPEIADWIDENAE